jgi:hypothetical protein
MKIEIEISKDLFPVEPKIGDEIDLIEYIQNGIIVVKQN